MMKKMLILIFLGTCFTMSFSGCDSGNGIVICQECSGSGNCINCEGQGRHECDYHDTNEDGFCLNCFNTNTVSCSRCKELPGRCIRCEGKGGFQNIN